MCTGQKPTCKDDGSPWQPSDPWGANEPQPLDFRAALMMIKADWGEFHSSLAFPTWQVVENPCPKCLASKRTWDSFDGLSPIWIPWEKKTLALYLQECSRREIIVTVTCTQELVRICGAMRFDARKQGVHGRALICDLPGICGVNLKKNDRLEPSLDVPDVGSVQECIHFPLTLVFWRMSKDEATRHRNPLFNERAHIGPEQLAPDELHTMHLGNFQAYILTVYWALWNADCYSLGTDGDSYDVAFGVRAGNDLEKFYRESRRQKWHKREMRFRILTSR